MTESLLSRRIVADIGAAQQLNVVSVCGTHGEAMTAIERGDARCVADDSLWL